MDLKELGPATFSQNSFSFLVSSWGTHYNDIVLDRPGSKGGLYWKISMSFVKISPGFKLGLLTEMHFKLGH